MKKILYSLIAVLAMVMSSCSNDDIEVFKTGGVTVNVNTQSVYNECGMDDIIRDFIRDENKYGIKVFSFLYDNNGKLLDKKETLQFDCNTASFTYNGLSQGDYTLLLVETIVEAQSGESPYWKFENTESLAESADRLFCYVLDRNTIKDNIIKDIAKNMKLTPYYVNANVYDSYSPIKDRIQPAVEKWLYGFRDSDYVITDSFHACVFSIIFHKQFAVIGNEERGMARFNSLLSLLFSTSFVDILFFTFSFFNDNSSWISSFISLLSNNINVLSNSLSSSF